MNITLTGTKVSMDGHTLAFEKNNLVDSMVVTVDTDADWQYKLDVKYPCKDNNGKELVNVIGLTRIGNTCTTVLQASMLPFSGKYTMQLRGITGGAKFTTPTHLKRGLNIVLTQARFMTPFQVSFTKSKRILQN